VEIKPLIHIAAQAVEDGELLLGLHAFGDYLKV
jgi:hypothetical protein